MTRSVAAGGCDSVGACAATVVADAAASNAMNARRSRMVPVSLPDALVNPLVEQRAGERPERVAELLRMVSNGVGIKRFLVPPDLEDGEMVIAIRLHGDDEAGIAGLLSGAERELLECRLRGVARRRDRIRVRDDVD